MELATLEDAMRGGRGVYEGVGRRKGCRGWGLGRKEREGSGGGVFGRKYILVRWQI